MFDQQRLTQALEAFREYSKTPDFSKDVKERRERKSDFQSRFKAVLKEFNDSVFAEIIKPLWAIRIWGNTDWIIKQIITDNGSKKLESSLRGLLAGRGLLGKRYEKFISEIKHMGPAIATELLCYSDPENAGIWNDRARKALAWLGVEEVPVESYRITAAEYDKFNEVLKELAKVLKAEGYKDVDLLTVDYFLWETWVRFAKDEEPSSRFPRRKLRSASRHDELRDKVAQIGSWLGFQIETEKTVASGAKVDVVWMARIANLGAVSYVFEVQDRGSIDSLIVNLQRAQKNPTVQKLIVVTDAEQVEKIKRELEALPENFRKVTTFWEDTDIENTHENLEQVTGSVAKLNLVED